MFFIGIDVHKKHSQICILDDSGELASELRMPTSRPDLADVLGIYQGARGLKASRCRVELAAAEHQARWR